MKDLSSDFEKRYDTAHIINTFTGSVWAVVLLLGLTSCTPMGRPIGGTGGGSDPFAGRSSTAPQDIELIVETLISMMPGFMQLAVEHAAVWVKSVPFRAKLLRSPGLS